MSKNQDRSNRAYRTLLTYQQFTGDTDVEASFIDLLTDMRHLAAEYAIEFDDALRISGDHFDAEIAEAAGE